MNTGSTTDYSGVPASLLSKLYHENAVEGEYTSHAMRVGLDPSYLARTVTNPTVPVVRLGAADKILMSVGLDVADLIWRGELVIVPLRRRKDSAMKIVKDEMLLAAELEREPWTKEEIQARVSELLADYDKYCTLTEDQVERREAERLRRIRRKEAKLRT